MCGKALLRPLHSHNHNRRLCTNHHHSYTTGVIIVNNHGRPRLVKLYQSVVRVCVCVYFPLSISPRSLPFLLPICQRHIFFPILPLPVVHFSSLAALATPFFRLVILPPSLPPSFTCTDRGRSPTKRHPQGLPASGTTTRFFLQLPRWEHPRMGRGCEAYLSALCHALFCVCRRSAGE